MHMGNKMWLCKRNLMLLDRDMGQNNNIEVRALVGWSVGHVVRNTFGDIVCNIMVEGLRYTINRRCGLLGMLARVFHVSIQQWKMGKQNTKHLSLRWTVRSVVKLFLFGLTLDLINQTRNRIIPVLITPPFHSVQKPTISHCVRSILLMSTKIALTSTFFSYARMI